MGAIFDIWSLGITIVIGGCFFSWNEGTPIGLDVFLCTTVLSGTAYVALMLCVGEILSGLPFTGGAFGLVRVTNGFFPGFLVSCSEVCYNITYVSLAVCTFSSMCSVVFLCDARYSPLFMLAFYVIASGCLICGKSLFFFWRTNQVIGLSCLFVVLLYSLGSLATFDSHSSERLMGKKTNLALALLNGFPRSTWFFIGIESLSFTCRMTPCPRKVFAKGCISCICTIFLTSILIVVCFYRVQPSNLTVPEPFALNGGFMSFLKCSYRQATFLSLPAVFGTAYGFIFSYGKLLCALSESRLLPSVFNTTKQNGMPYAAIIIGSFASYLLCCVIYFFPVLYPLFTNFSLLSAYVTYCSYAIAYICLKKRFLSIKYSFPNPLGIAGAVYALGAFLFGIVSVAFFQKDYCAPLGMLVTLWSSASVYYFVVAKNVEKLSPEEQESLLIAHIIKFENRKRNVYRLNYTSWTSTLTRSSCQQSPKISRVSIDNNSRRISVVQPQNNQTSRKFSDEIRERAQKAFCVENVDFCNAALTYRLAAIKYGKKKRSLDRTQALHSSLVQIINTFVETDSPNEVNISSIQRADIGQFKDFSQFSLLDQTQMVTILDEAASEIEKVLFTNLKLSIK